MKINIKATKIELSPEIRAYVEKKVLMLEKYLGDTSVTNCDVELEHYLSAQNKGDVYRAEINLAVPGTILRVEKREKTLNKALDKVKDHLVLAIKKYKEKKIDKKRGK